MITPIHYIQCTCGHFGDQHGYWGCKIEFCRCRKMAPITECIKVLTSPNQDSREGR